jgi:hypothetical protein
VKAVATLLLSLTFASAAPAAGATRLVVLPTSQVWLDGRTNVSSWQCAGKGLAGELAVTAPRPELERQLLAWQRQAPGTQLQLSTDGDWGSRMELQVPIGALGCGNRLMERDLQLALDAAAHPEIRYRLRHVREARYSPAGKVAAYQLVVDGELTLAGRTRPITLQVTAHRLSESRFRLRGGVAVRMTDFGVDPPEALMGMIRARDELWVSVDLELGEP